MLFHVYIFCFSAPFFYQRRGHGGCSDLEVLLSSVLPNEETYPTKRGRKRKIIDSNMPAEWGYVSFTEGNCVLDGWFLRNQCGNYRFENVGKMAG